MPMYFPDLESVKKLALDMQKNKDEKKYTGIVPTTDDELPLARKELAKYMREVWKDEIAAIEVEEAVTEENYESKFEEVVRFKMFLSQLQ